jgi:2-hydroxychromene-2-carboxylate isomerase
MPDVNFFFDLGSPYAYLTAERIDTLLPGVRWQPVLLGGLFKATGRSSWALGDEQRRQAGIAEIERRARAYGLPPVVWPEPWPGNYLTAMLAATYAFAEGRGRQFALNGFRNAFQRGLELSERERVLETGTQVGLDRAGLDAAIDDSHTKAALRTATDRARELGVFGVPTVAIDGELFWGDDRLEQAADHLQAVTRA